MICVLDDNDYCTRHGRVHYGHLRRIALDPSETGERYRAVWDKHKPIEAEKPKPIRQPLPLAKLCTHNTGENGREKAGCTTCTTYGCNVKGTVRLKDCVYCEDWKQHEDTIPLTMFGEMGRWQEAYNRPAQLPRHLLFHIWPRKLSQGTWQRNLDQLKQRWPLFTGKKVIAVATSPDSHSLEAVQEYMRDYQCEWVHVENDHTLREVKTFLALFEQVEGLPGYTFYGQGKGVTKPVNRGVSIHRWTSAMYELLLDYWPLVEQQFKQYHTVGAFKKSVNGAFHGSSSTWHYSGSFCWFKNDELWRRNWRDIERVWFGIESYPSMIYSRDESACIFHCRDKQFSLYNLKYWQQVEGELEAWRREQAKHRLDIGSLTTGTNHSTATN